MKVSGEVDTGGVSSQLVPQGMTLMGMNTEVKDRQSLEDAALMSWHQDLGI